jgi:hypothetical protein
LAHDGGNFSTTDRWTDVKVVPSNQTLILAGERGPGGYSAPALPSAGGETTLTRVTIVASRPDDTLVYLQADYSPLAESSARALLPTTAAPSTEARGTLPALPARLAQQAPRGNSYSSRRGIELYASTERMLAETPTTHIDVHA